MVQIAIFIKQIKNQKIIREPIYREKFLKNKCMWLDDKLVFY